MSQAEFASGKGHRDENFPVASRLIAARHRAPILAFYRFARAADDVADHPTAAPHDKLARLETMRATLLGRSDADPTSAGLRTVLAERGLDATHPLDLLEAFTRDVTKTRYADWDELMDYCRYSAAPVGRFVLDVHGEDRALWPASDALCAALQVINHLQDCAKDYRALDRVYLPQDLLGAAGVRVDALAGPRATPGLRAVIGECARRSEALLDRAAGFARGIASRGLALEVAVIHRLARSLAARLCHRDPLAERVHHGRAETLALAARGVLGHMVRR